MSRETDLLAQLHGPARNTKKAETFPSAEVEAWIARKLGVELVHNVGTSSPEIRRELIRARITSQGLAGEAAGTKDGVPESWKSFFERVYSQPLEGA